VRKKIMQNPTSPAAQSLLEGAAAMRAGQLTPPADVAGDGGITVHPPVPMNPTEK
jgi:hypothetical protein